MYLLGVYTMDAIVLHTVLAISGRWILSSEYNPVCIIQLKVLPYSYSPVNFHSLFWTKTFGCFIDNTCRMVKVEMRKLQSDV